MDPAPSRALLDDAQVAEALAGLPGWQGDRSGLVRELTAPSFIGGIRIVDAVADAAERLDHHPDIDIRWRRLRFALSTHSSGGVTETDVVLARAIDAVVQELAG